MIPKIIKGNKVFDNRGSLRFSNKLSLKNVKRFYIVHNYDKNLIRAWHGHLLEEKLISCLDGTFQICAVKLDNIKKPNKKNKIYNFYLNSENNNFIHIPKGYANGTKSLEKNSKLLVFSTSTLKQSLKDDYRFASDYWNPWK